MKYILFIFFCFVISCKETKKDTGLKIVDNSIGLKMIVPSSFVQLDQKEKEEKVQKGKKFIDKLHDSTFILSDVQKVNLFRHDDKNMFVLNTQDYDFDTHGDYKSAIKDINKLIYETQFKNYPTSQIDSSTSKEMIDGLEFIKFILNAKIDNNLTMHVVNYNRLFKNNKDFTASVIFTNEELGKEILKAVTNAKFKK